MPKENNSRKRNKILVILAVFLLLSVSVGAVDIPEPVVDLGVISHLIANAFWVVKNEIIEIGEHISRITPFTGTPGGPATIDIATGKKVGAAAKISHAGVEIIESGAIAGYTIGMELMTNAIADDISKNLRNYILENPSPLHPGVNSTMHFFVSLLIPAYILAIVLLGIYLQFLSASPKGRSRAKSMFAKMVIGMVLVSVSPNLLDAFFNISSGVTGSILDQGKTEMDVTIDVYNGVLLKTWKLAIASLYGIEGLNLALGGAKLGGAKWLKWGRHSHGPSKALGKVAKHFKLIAEPSRTVPMLMTILTLFIGVYGILAFRFFMVMFFTLIFPFTIFFLCFDPTKKLGGTLLEQTLLWTLIQEFYAITVIAVGMGMLMLPDALSKHGFGFIGFMNISFFEAAACITMMIGPIVLFMLLRKLLPPL